MRVYFVSSAKSGDAVRREGLVDGNDAVFVAPGRVRVEIAAGAADVEVFHQFERRVEVAGKVVVQVAGPIRLDELFPGPK